MPHRGRVRWGILGVAMINSSLIPGAQAAKNAELVAIASRRPAAAEAAARQWKIPRVHKGYDELLADPDIDAVYIPLPNHLHAEWTVRAADAGKHILCEKPLVIALRELELIREAAARNNVYVLEAFMYRFLPRWRRAEEMVWSGAIGEPRIVRIGFAFTVYPREYNIRFDPKAGGGITWDMGCYAVNMSRTLFREDPHSVLALGHTRPGTDVDTSIEVLLRFPSDRAALAHCSFDYPNPYSQVEVVGSEGWLSMPGTGFRRESYTRILYHHRDEPGDEIFLNRKEPNVLEFEAVDPYMLEVEHLSQCILEKKSPRYGLDDARGNTRALLAILQSIEAGREIPLDTIKGS
jgi:D-xylose 1-dehydrogenase (NADP+, D-xylono-1,5-lactone-forming)